MYNSHQLVFLGQIIYVDVTVEYAYICFTFLQMSPFVINPTLTLYKAVCMAALLVVTGQFYRSIVTGQFYRLIVTVFTVHFRNLLFL